MKKILIDRLFTSTTNPSTNTQKVVKKIFTFFTFYFLTIVSLYIYTAIISIGYFHHYTLVQNSVLEYITIFLLYAIFFITAKARNLFIIPILFLLSYFALDVVSDAYNRYVDYSDILNIPLLFDALLQSKGNVIYLSTLVPIIVIYLFVKKLSMRVYTLAILIIIILFTLPMPNHPLLTQPYMAAFDKYAYTQSYFWTPNKVKIDYAKTGRLSTFFSQGMLKSQNHSEIYNYSGNQKNELFLKVKKLKDKIEHRNVYLIGLESFFLPRDLKKLKFNYLNHDANKTYDVVKNSSLQITSIFGGGTIQSEFEALCGVPALQKISAFEFTEFIGAPTNCLPQILDTLNFATTVTNTYKPQPSFEALKSVGFEKINFPKEYFANTKTYLTNKNKAKGEYAIFDADLYKQNQAYIKKEYTDQNKTVFDYMFTVWGHAFHDMHAKTRPTVIKVLNTDKLGVSTHTIDAINQAYYRIEALQNYFDELKKSDPTALVIAYSDHRPVLDGVESWKKYGYDGDLFSNYIVIMDRSKYIKFKKPFVLYALPDIILDLLTNHDYSKHNISKIDSSPTQREKYLTEYYKIMANAMNTNYKTNSFIIVPNETYKFNNTNIPFKNFSQAETTFRWSSAKTAKILFHIEDKNLFNEKLYLHIATLGDQKISIYLNGHKLYDKLLNTPDKMLNLRFKKSWLHEKKLNSITFDLPNAHRPSNGDTRTLAIQFKSMQFEKLNQKSKK